MERPSTRKFSHIVKMINSQLPAGMSQADKEKVNKRIQNYGCHCFPGGSKKTNGKGPAADHYDELCRKLSRCRSCIDFDYDTDEFWNSNIGKYRFKTQGAGNINCDGNSEKRKSLFVNAMRSSPLNSV